MCAISLVATLQIVNKKNRRRTIYNSTECFPPI